ncbi:MAG: hypothetical protein AB1714_28430 [Acidobacteriota bacterium]
MGQYLGRLEREVVSASPAEFVSSRRLGCPTETELRAYSFGYLPLFDRIRMSRHVHRCVSCYATTVEVRNSEAADQIEDIPTATIRARVLMGLGERARVVPSWWKRPAMALAASLAVVALSLGIFLRQSPQHEPVFRGKEFRIQAEISQSPGSGIEIRWKSDQQAQYYNLDIYRADLEEVIFKTRLEATKYRLSDAERALLRAGERYYCRVVGFNEFNEKVASSESLSFAVDQKSSGILAATE